MNRFTISRFASLLSALLLLVWAGKSQAQAPNLKIVWPLHGSNLMNLQYDPVAGATEYEYQRKEEGGAYAAAVNVGNSTNVNDGGPFAANTRYIYQVRAKVGGTWGAWSNERGNSFKRGWPTKAAANCTTAESVELLHGFGQPLKIGRFYLHEGIDIHATSGVGDECVVAPIGGRVDRASGSGSNIAVNIAVWVNGAVEYIQYNHLKSLDPALMTGTTVEPGQKLGQINDGVAGWDVLSSHTHMHYWSTYNNLFGTTISPFRFFSSNTYKDPQGSVPQLLDTDGEGNNIRFLEGPHSATYRPDDGKVFHATDIVVEAVDKQSSDAPWQVSKVIGYYIERKDGNAWVNAVKSAGTPYVLMDNFNYYNSNSSTGGDNPTLMRSIIEQSNAVKATTPAGYAWEQYFTFIVTNTKGTNGAANQIDSSQCWATNARNTVGQDNGYVANYDSARCVEEAKFKDGDYRIQVVLRDYIQSAVNLNKEVKVDNFRPWVKKVTVENQGNKIYEASWTWNAGSGELTHNPNTSMGKACGETKVTVTMSEAMKDLTMKIPDLGYTNNSPTEVAGSDKTEWEFTIPKNIIEKGEKDKKYKMHFSGHDVADTEMQGFTSTSNIPGANLAKRKKDGSWNPASVPTEDNIHEFEIKVLNVKMVSKKDVECPEDMTGEATVTVTDGMSPYTYEWTPYGGTAPTATGLGVGSYTCKVEDSEECVGKADTLIEADSDLEASISGGGMQVFCDTDGPPSVTLTASATGGEPPYTFTWRTRTVSSSGFHTVTVTDKNGCTNSATTFIWFIPIRCSRDPNDIIGPDGYGADKWVSINDRLPYMIRFENDPDFATAPAQEVFIDHVLDSTVDLYSFRLRDFGFANMVFQVPPNRTFYSQRLDVRDSLGIFVDVTAGLDIAEHKAFWIFRSIDPATGLPPNDANTGFLPINDTLTNKGEGFVNFTVMPISTAQTGDTIHAEAEIVFDINAPLKTPPIFNLIDAFPPTSSLDSLPAQIDSTVVLTCSAQDDPGGVGVASYSIYVSENGGPYQTVVTDLEIDSSYTFRGDPGRTYCFYTRAKDHVGNEEAVKSLDEGCFFQKEVGFVTVLTPNGGEQYCIGDTATISWTSGGISTVDVRYSPDGGSTYYALATGRSAGDSVLTWVLDDSLSGSSSYLVQVKSSLDSANADTSDAFFTVNDRPAKPNPVASGPTTFCDGDSVTLTGPASMSLYDWSSGASTQAITVSASGTFTLTVTDGFGCESYPSDPVLVTVNPLPAQPVLSAAGPTTFCDGDSVQLSAPSGFVGYSWSTGETLPSIWVTTSGSYTATVTDANGCESPLSAPVSVTVNALPPQPVVSASGATTFCDGDSVLLSAPSGYASYLWSSGATDSTLAVYLSGSYSVAVTDANGCTSPTSAVTTVTVNPLPQQPVITANGPTAFCDGDSVQLAAPAGYSQYNWSTGDTAVAIWVTTALSATVVVTDGNGCESPVSAAVSTTVNPLPSQPVITAGGPTTFCAGDSVQLSAPAGFSSYSWSSGESAASIWVQAAGSYSVSVTDANGCESPLSTAVSVSVNALPPQPAVTASGPTAFCAGDSVVLSAPAGYAAYLWSNGVSASSLTVDTSGTFAVQVTDANGCVSPASLPTTVTVNSLPPQPVITSAPGLVFCAGDSTVLSAPTGYSSYLWSTGATTPVLTVDTAGTFTVQVTDANGCESPVSAAVSTTVNPLPSQPVLTAGGPTTFCDGDSVQLSAPAGFSSYAWSTGASTASIWVLNSGSFTATVTDANGCESPLSAPVSVTVNALPPQPAISASGATTFCDGDSVQLSAPAGYAAYLWSNGVTAATQVVDTSGTFTVQVTDVNGCVSPLSSPTTIVVNALPPQPVVTSTPGLAFCQGDSTVLSAPTGYSSYLWSNGATTPNLMVDTAGTFTVQVTDANGCVSPLSAAVTTTVNPLPPQPVLAAGGPTTFCDGDSVQLGAPAGYSGYIWSTGQLTDSIWVTTSGSYTASVVDANGCESPVSAPLVVTVNPLPPQPNIVAMPGLSFCAGDSTTLMAPSGYAAYAWSSGDTTQDINVTTSGSFTVIVTDANGCVSPLSAAATTTVNALPPKPAITTQDSLAFCEGASITLNGPAGFATYSWSTGASSSTIAVSTAGSFWLTVTDANGCESPSSDTVVTTTIPLPATPVVTLIGTDSLFCTVSGTAYQWFLDGSLLPDTGQTIQAAQSGEYQVIVFNGPCPSDTSLGISVTVSITRDLSEAGIDVFPNPTRGWLFIQGELPTASLVEIHVFNALGQLVYEDEGYARNGKLKEKVRLDHVADGVYVLRLRVGTDYMFKKVQVQQ